MWWKCLPLAQEFALISTGLFSPFFWRSRKSFLNIYHTIVHLYIFSRINESLFRLLFVQKAFILVDLCLAGLVIIRRNSFSFSKWFGLYLKGNITIWSTKQANRSILSDEARNFVLWKNFIIDLNEGPWAYIRGESEGGLLSESLFLFPILLIYFCSFAGSIYNGTIYPRIWPNTW